jgi:hypothetical protein
MIADQTLSVERNTSKDTKESELIISVADVDYHELGTVDIVVGRVGIPSVERTLRVGGAIYFETLDQGLFEVRVLHIRPSPQSAVLRISHLRPGRSLVAGLGTDDIDNTPFEPQEVAHIRASLKGVQEAVTQRQDVTPEQTDYINRKLDEIIDASTRVGRKDWVNLAVGTLTNIVVNAGLSSGVARFIFQTAGDALAWLVGQTLQLLS